MTSIRSCIRVAGVLAGIGWSAASFAGGHGGAPSFRPVVHGSAHMAAGGGFRGWSGLRAPHSAAFWPRFGGARTGPVYGSRFGHTNTAAVGHGVLFPHTGWLGGPGPRQGLGLQSNRLGYGRRHLVGYAFAPRRFAYGRVLPGRIGAGTFGGYGYGADLGVDSGYPSGFAFTEPSLAATFAEPPLGPSPYTGQGGLSFEDQDGGYAPSPGYEGGPRIIRVRADDRPPGARKCACESTSGHLPIVYRFGVGSYY